MKRSFLAVLAVLLTLPNTALSDASNVLRLAKSADGKAALLRFPSKTGHLYNLQSSADLKTWTTVREGLEGTDEELVIDDMDAFASEPAMYFRLVSQPKKRETIKVTNTYSSGKAPGDLVLGEDPNPFDPTAPKWEPSAGGGDLVEGGEFVDAAIDFAPGLAVDGDAFFGEGGGAGFPADRGGDDFIIIDPLPWPPGEPEPQPGANLLTAAEWNDHEDWLGFQNFINTHDDHFTHWQLDHQRRIILAFIDPNGKPLHDVQVTYKNECFAGATARTHNDGKVAIFPTTEAAECLETEALNLDVLVAGQTYETSFQLKSDNDQTWTLEIPLEKTSQARNLDLAWVVDVTGSMGDELRFIREELIDIVRQIGEAEQVENVRIATIFYRDRGDRFVTRVHDFNNDLAQVQDDIDAQRASGGGDFPESVNEALFETMNTLTWRDADTVRLAFLVADAPPHYYADEQYTYRDAVPDAHEFAIKLFPVAGSGIDKSTEFLFRNLAVASMGKYIFITDDSGIGGKHLDPDIEQFQVETLNAILIRTVLEEYRRGLD